MDSQNTYEEFREENRKTYASTQPVFSPALSEKVHFNAEGFNHLLFKGPRVEREIEVQVTRLTLLPLAIRLIELSTTHQEYEERFKKLKIKKYKERKYLSIRIQYWALIAILDNQKIKVVLRKVNEDGQLHFWSVMPNWITSKNRDEKLFTNKKHHS